MSTGLTERAGEKVTYDLSKLIVGDPGVHPIFAVDRGNNTAAVIEQLKSMAVEENAVNDNFCGVGKRPRRCATS